MGLLSGINGLSGDYPIQNLLTPAQVKSEDSVSIFNKNTDGITQVNQQKTPQNMDDAVKMYSKDIAAFQKSFGLTGEIMPATAAVIKKDGSKVEVRPFADGSGKIEVITSKDGKLRSYVFYKNDYSENEPIGRFNIREMNLGQVKGYTHDIINYEAGFATN